MATLQKAIEIAVEAHKLQKDKTGEPYTMHLIRVMERGNNEIEKICGVLHDLVEDTDWTFESLSQEGFSEAVIDVLKCVTKTSENENYDHFIERVKQNKTAVNVKLNDLQDNMDIRRLPIITESDFIRLNKYLRVYRDLKAYRDLNLIV